MSCSVLFMVILLILELLLHHFSVGVEGFTTGNVVGARQDVVELVDELLVDGFLLLA